jgi:hypothetical protein
MVEIGASPRAHKKNNRRELEPRGYIARTVDGCIPHRFFFGKSSFFDSTKEPKIFQQFFVFLNFKIYHLEHLALMVQ